MPKQLDPEEARRRRDKRVARVKKQCEFNSKVYDIVFEMIVKSTGEQKKMLLYIEDLLNRKGKDLRSKLGWGDEDEENN